MKPNKNIWIKSVFGILVSAAFLWAALLKVQWTQFCTTLQEINLGWVVPAFLITILVCLFRAWRWHYLFRPIQNIKYSNLFSVIMIGFLANNVLPARLGDLVMAHFIAKKEGVTKSLAFGTILIDRIMDVTTLFILLIIALFAHSFPEWVDRIVNLGVLFLVLALSVMLALIFFTDYAARLLMTLLTPIPSRLRLRLLGILSRLVQGFAVLKEWRLIMKVIGISIIIWLFLGLGVYFLIISFHFQVPFWSCFFILAVVNLGLAIPSSPGFIGTFQFFCVSALTLFGISKAPALGFAVVYHLSQYAPTTVLGFIYLVKEHLQLGSLLGIIKRK